MKCNDSGVVCLNMQLYTWQQSQTLCAWVIEIDEMSEYEAWDLSLPQGLERCSLPYAAFLVSKSEASTCAMQTAQLCLKGAVPQGFQSQSGS